MSRKQQKITAPSHLSKATAAWYATVLTEFELEEHHRRILESACSCWDNAERARETLAKEGQVVHDRFDAPKVHPCVKVELENRALFLRSVRELGLDVAESMAETRPPRITANSNRRAS